MFLKRLYSSRSKSIQIGGLVSSFVVICCILAVSLFAAKAVFSAEILSSPGEDGTQVISIVGDLKKGDERKFILTALPIERAIVVFNSNGGDLLAGIEIGRAIRLKGYSTLVDEKSTCASACAFAWLAGTPRYVADGASVGFHAAYIISDGVAKEIGVGNAILGSYLNQLGLSQNSIAFVTSAAPNSMSWLTEDSAKIAGFDYVALPASKKKGDVQKSSEVSTDNGSTIVKRPEISIGPTIAPLERPTIDRTHKKDLMPLEIAPPPTPSRTGGKSTFVISPFTDILGCDLKKQYNIANYEACEKTCLENGKCSAFTHHAKRSICLLKSCVGLTIRNLAVSSGLSRLESLLARRIEMTILEGEDFPGSDFDRIRPSTFNTCVHACDDSPRCKAFSYLPNRHECWLKTGYGKPISSSLIVSGYKTRDGLDGVFNSYGSNP